MSIILKSIFVLLCILPLSITAQLKEKQTLYDTNLNPILPGDYADPSILRDGDDYYMTHSSFEYYPGLLIWHSKDMINWKPICRALHRYVGAVWAPDFFKYKNKYYIYFPAGGTIWVIISDSPEGPWSDPVDLKIGQIDPGHIVDSNGHRYLYLNYGNIVKLTEDGLSKEGEPFKTYDGWDIPDDWDVACKCLESPKLIYKDGYFYLTVAEGGTVGPPTAHMVISARSKNVTGPWENSPYNPIVHTYSKDEQWHAKGHGTLIEDKENNWWIVYHAYEKDFYTLGRQTLIEPIEWTTDGWFNVASSIQTEIEITEEQFKEKRMNLSLSDQFEGDELGWQWTYFKDYNPSRVNIYDNTLHFKAQGDCPENSAPLLCVPIDKSYEIQVKYEVVGNAKGGLILFYDESMYAGLVTNGDNITIYRRAQNLNAGKNSIGRNGYLKIRNIENTVTFYYSSDGEEWYKIKRSFMVDCYNHKAFGNFLSLKVGLVSMGKDSINFENFIYTKI